MQNWIDRQAAFFGLMVCVICPLLSITSGCDAPSKSDPNVAPTELRFGVIATESTAGLKEDLQPFLDDMTESLGLPVKAYFASDYAGVIEAMRFGKVDFGWFGNASAIEAIERADGEVFAQTVPAGGEPGYWSVLIVHSDSDYHTVDDLLRDAAELSFGNGDPHSTSGNLIPTFYLWNERGIDPIQTFKRVINSNHESNALAVANKQLDFSTNNTESLAIMKDNHPELLQKLRVVWKSPLIPSDPLIWRKSLHEGTRQRVRDFILSYGQSGPDQERQRKVLAGISSGWAPFRESSDKQLLPIREMMLAGKIEDLKKNNSIGETAKASQLEQLQGELNIVRAERIAGDQATTGAASTEGSSSENSAAHAPAGTSEES